MKARALAAVLLMAGGLALAQDSVRPEIATPLQAAQERMKASRYQEALGKLREADAVANRSDYENHVLERMRGSAAMGAGDTATAIRSFEAVLASGRLQNAERLQILEALANAAYAAKDYA